jgi:hypothetical protein
MKRMVKLKEKANIDEAMIKKFLTTQHSDEELIEMFKQLSRRYGARKIPIVLKRYLFARSCLVLKKILLSLIQ